jgi:3-polyprenyl-4-hydroxybenzoate decarboxylase
MADVTDMRGYIEVLEQMGELRRIKNADLKTEVGALTELAADKEGPALLFSGDLQRVSHVQTHRTGDGHQRRERHRLPLRLA